MDKLKQVQQVQQHEAELGKFFTSKYEELQKSAFVDKVEEVPNRRGVYVIYDKDKNPIYVGRTNKLKSRLIMHTLEYSSGNSATFAFGLAKKEYEKKHGRIEKKRAELERDEDFQNFFAEQKKYLREQCSYKVLLVENDVLQTMLEPYLAYKLGTYPELNTFENR